MSLGQELAPHLPFLRRYARALTGSQQHGDAFVRATLEAIVAAPNDRLIADAVLAPDFVMTLPEVEEAGIERKTGIDVAWEGRGIGHDRVECVLDEPVPQHLTPGDRARIAPQEGKVMGKLFT